MKLLYYVLLPVFFSMSIFCMENEYQQKIDQLRNSLKEQLLIDYIKEDSDLRQNVIQNIATIKERNQGGMGTFLAAGSFFGGLGVLDTLAFIGCLTIKGMTFATDAFPLSILLTGATVGCAMGGCFFTIAGCQSNQYVSWNKVQEYLKMTDSEMPNNDFNVDTLDKFIWRKLSNVQFQNKTPITLEFHT